jgi:hypothetical protein
MVCVPQVLSLTKGLTPKCYIATLLNGQVSDAAVCVLLDSKEQDSILKMECLRLLATIAPKACKRFTQTLDQNPRP